MTIAVLPFNAGPETTPMIARQLANFPCDIVRNHTSAEIHAVNYLVQIDQEGGAPKFANVNASEALNEHQMIEQLFDQSKADAALDGLLVKSGDGYELTVRLFNPGEEEPAKSETLTFTNATVFTALRKVINLIAEGADVKLPDDLSKDENLFGTNSGEAFVKFLESYDALQYIERTQGQVVNEFNPSGAMVELLEAAKIDKDWEAPYVTMVQLVRACANYRIGNPPEMETHLKAMIETAPEDGRGYFALGELYQAIGDLNQATNAFEKASQIEPNEPAIITRLGILQLQAGMPVNAERNFRKAIEMEGPDKPSMDFLANVLVQTGRAHEVPALWKELVDANPQNAVAHAKLAISHLQADQEEQGIRAFDVALEALEDPTIVKRHYATVLMRKGDFDRAMDFYEDSLDVAPNDVQLLIEYAQTLQAAGREFEVPKVLKDVLASNPDPNTRAQTLAWLTELEQPKRVENVANAQKMLEQDDPEGALRMLRPMRNWLADYWQMWAMIANAHNRKEEYAEAEEAATRLVNFFPGCEPGWAELATALMGQNKNDEAYNAMRFAMGQVQNSLPIALNYGLAAKRVGNEDEAKTMAKQIREAIGANPELEPILAEIER